MSAKNGSILLKLGLVLVVIAAGVVAAFFRLRDFAVVEKVIRDKAVHAVTGSVTVFADKDLQELKSEVAGRVVWCSPQINAGKSFAKDDPLVRLDTTELERRIAKTESDYRFAVKQRETLRENNPARQVAAQNLENALRLQKRGDIADEQVSALKRALAQIDTDLKIADLQAVKAEEDFKLEMTGLKELLGKMTIRATADGMTHGVMVAEGSLINGGATVATFYRNERIVIAKIGEEDFGYVKLGQPAKVRLLSYPNRDFDAKVSQLLQFGESQTQLYSVYLDVDLEPTKLLPNSTGETTITVGERENQPLVPRRAVMNNDHVFVVRNGQVETRPVEVGYVGLNLVEIRKGVTPGELVIVEDLEQFRPGQRVTVLSGN